jgi:hypothetical protein
LRTDVAALRSDISEIKRLLLARREPLTAPLPVVAADDTRGRPLMPYARPNLSSSLIG